MNKYIPDEYFSVIYKKTGNKKCDCGWEVDAMKMVSMNPEELTYVKNTNHLMGQVIDIEVPKALPTSNVVISAPEYHQSMYPEMVDDQDFVIEPIGLPQSELEPLNLS